MKSYSVYRYMTFKNRKPYWMCVGIKQDRVPAIQLADDLRDKASAPWVVVTELNSKTKEKKKIYERHGKFTFKAG
jgi:hypothetical protein